MPTDTTMGEPEDWLVEYDGRDWRVTRFSRTGSDDVTALSSKGEAKRHVKDAGLPDDVVTVFTKSGKDWDTKYVRELTRSGRGLFSDLG